MNRIIDYDKNGFIINGKHEFLIGGEFHYFRVPSAMWEDRLQKMKTMGANLISVYIPWNLHEPKEGLQHWDGDYDLDRFLTLCEDYGLYVLIKPGPYICAELDFGGHPDWLIPKIARGEFRIRTLDKGYLDLCRLWYESCAKQIKKHLITNGGTIIAAQIENEYDHLIEYGEETITVDDAIEYFMFLRDVMDEFGIDVPKFANEAEFLRGRGIIDTRTYYPNIPGLWWWEFERFEKKLLESKASQSDSPIMILELQAGWFSQIGQPTYSPGLEVVEGVSKSVFITGASIINYYMMVGGTTFPFIGARGDISLGGQGNITSYDFGGAPIGETGEIHKDKYYWIKGFIRFAKEFSHIIAESDGKRYVKIISGGENIALLEKDGGQTDPSLSKTYENFTTYEEGNDSGRFFFVRNAEDDEKNLTIKISSSLTGTEYVFNSTVFPKETRIFPIAFTFSGSNLKMGYSTSEILLSKKYGTKTAIVLYGRKGTVGEALFCTTSDGIEVLEGEIKVLSYEGGLHIEYIHGGIVIFKIQNAYFFIVQDDFIGRIEEMETGLLFHKTYYLQEISESSKEAQLLLQIKENSNNLFYFFPFGEAFEAAFLDR
ncbi:MAG: beta-galactosidase, partial [Oscillospiraceae bacterium]|nr:beta-galactosidase [Oscillospiraceae bacterium]